MTKPTTTIKTGNNNVIQQLGGGGSSGSGDAVTTTANSEIALEQQQQIVTRPPWMGPVTPISSPPKQLPAWIAEVTLGPYHVAAAGRPEPTGAPLDLAAATAAEAATAMGAAGRPGRCPEMVWRSIRWPESEPGQAVGRPCPAHTMPSAPLAQATAAATAAPVSLVCLPGGQWAERAQVAGRCHSLWLRNLTQRLDAGDSPLSILGELVHRTQSASGGAHKPNQSSQPLPAWLAAAHATSSLTQAAHANNNHHQAARPGAAASRFPLFGEDLVQMGRIVGRLVDEMDELLARISDDKQRITFAREMIQVSRCGELRGGGGRRGVSRGASEFFIMVAPLLLLFFLPGALLLRQL
jgi:hypothetical protein